MEVYDLDFDFGDLFFRRIKGCKLVELTPVPPPPHKNVTF